MSRILIIKQKGRKYGISLVEKANNDDNSDTPDTPDTPDNTETLSIGLASSGNAGNFLYPENNSSYYNFDYTLQIYDPYSAILAIRSNTSWKYSVSYSSPTSGYEQESNTLNGNKNVTINASSVDRWYKFRTITNSISLVVYVLRQEIDSG
jgi:hypothetical protein